jgi:hypothetical protein
VPATAGRSPRPFQVGVDAEDAGGALDEACSSMASPVVEAGDETETVTQRARDQPVRSWPDQGEARSVRRIEDAAGPLPTMMSMKSSIAG